MAATETKNRDEKTQTEDKTKRQPLPYLFEKELIQKQTRYFWIVEDFAPTAVGRKIKTLEKKLNARHEQIHPARYNEKFLCYTELSRRKTQYGLPLLESQVYGWLPKEISYGDQALFELNFIRAPKLRGDLTVFGEKLSSEKITERPKFNGLRFFLH